MALFSRPANPGAGSIAPLLVIGYETTRTTRNVIHEIIGNSAPDVTLRPATLRSGRLEILAATLGDGRTIEDMHALGETFLLVDASLPERDMSYVADGAIELVLQEDQIHAVLSVGFREVLP